MSRVMIQELLAAASLIAAFGALIGPFLFPGMGARQTSARGVTVVPRSSRSTDQIYSVTMGTRDAISAPIRSVATIANRGAIVTVAAISSAAAISLVTTSVPPSGSHKAVAPSSSNPPAPRSR